MYLDGRSDGEDTIKYNSKKGKWNLLMNCLPNDIENSLSINEIAEKYKLPRKKILEYCNRWVKKGLLKKL